MSGAIIEDDEPLASLGEMAEADADINRILTGSDIRASFKIEIHFGPGRSGLKDFRALLLLMQSGKFFHGGGDGQMYTCLDHRLFEKDNTTPPSCLPIIRKMMHERTEWGCGAPITGSDIRGPVAMCPGCKNMIPAQHLTGQLPFYGSVVQLAELATILFHRLKDDADVYCKYHPTDIRYKTQAEVKGMEEARRLRGLMIYPLYRLMKDISAGATIESRFKACFLA